MNRNFLISGLAGAMAFATIAAALSLNTRSTDEPKGNGGGLSEPKPFLDTQLIVDQEVFDHGTVKQNQTLSATFTLKNPSQVALEVIKISKSCSCSEATLSSQNISGGGQVTMKVDWQTRDRSGPTEVPLSIAYQQAGGEGYGVLQCAIRGTVQPKFHVLPKQIVFFDKRQAKIQLKPGFEAAPKIASVKSSDPKLVLEHTEDTVTITVPPDHPIPERGTLLIFAEGSVNPVSEVRMFQKPE